MLWSNAGIEEEEEEEKGEETIREDDALPNPPELLAAAALATDVPEPDFCARPVMLARLSTSRIRTYQFCSDQHQRRHTHSSRRCRQ